MTDTPKKQPLTGRQQRFAYFFVHDARGVSVKAAELAGYKNPRVEGPRLRNTPHVRAEIDRLFAEDMAEAETLKEVRIQEYRTMIERIRRAFDMRAARYKEMGVSPFLDLESDDPALQAAEQNTWLLSEVPPESLTGLYIRKSTVTGQGTRTIEWVFDYHAVKELRETQKQLAIETGHWTIRQDLSGTMSFANLRQLADAAEE